MLFVVEGRGGGVLIVVTGCSQWTAAVGLLGAGCGEPETFNSRALTAAPSTGSPETSPSADRSGFRGDRHQQLDPELRQQPGGPDEIQIAIGDQRFQATLSDSAAARDLVAQTHGD